MIERLGSSLVVLKKIKVEDITAADSYQQEARRLAHLRHKYVVRDRDQFRETQRERQRDTYPPAAAAAVAAAVCSYRCCL